MRRNDANSGFTLVESAISMVVLGLLLTSVLSIAVETSVFLGDNEVDTVLQTEARAADVSSGNLPRSCCS